MGECSNQPSSNEDSNAPTATTSETTAPKKLLSTASLYVGDLHPDVTEAMIYEKFSKVGPVLSIRVCRDMITRKSLGYAYVNFQTHSDAEQAMDELNFECILDRPIRIMWSQRDPAIRKSGVGNIFIKNLDKSITAKELCDTFQNFGHILSVKISQDELGNSKGYGFVHFESEESALKAIDTVNGKLIKDKQVFVGKFIPKSKRGIKETEAKFTNCFIKNFGDTMTEEQIKEMFEKYGEILSIKIMESDDGKSKGFGFVSFKEPGSAAAACEELNNTDVNGRMIYVGRAQKKAERLIELKHKYEKKPEKCCVESGTVNLYIKNLEDEIDDEQLRLMFSDYGTIISAKVMSDSTGRSRGFGFVCFAESGGATKAVNEMNGKLIGSKPLYVAVAQKKEDRQQQLLNLHTNRLYTFPNGSAPLSLAANGFHPMSAAMAGGLLRPAQFTANLPSAQQMYAAQSGPLAAVRSVANRWPPSAGPQHANMMAAAQMMAPGNRMAYLNSGPGGGQNNGLMRSTAPITAANSRPILGPQPGVTMQTLSANSRPIMSSQSMSQHQFMNAQRTNYPAMIQHQQQQQQHLAQQQQQAQQQAQQQTQQQAQQMARNANGAGMDQKQLVGEMLFARVHALEPNLAGKITGMLLEYDDPKKIFDYLDDPKVIAKKVSECLEAIQQASKGQTFLHSDGPSVDQAAKKEKNSQLEEGDKSIEQGVGIPSGDRC